MRLLTLIFLLACCLLSNAIANDTEATYTLYLVRHAEKQQGDSRDPELTPTGQQRAENLSRRLVDKNIEGIWSSDYKRTRDTAMPLASALGLDLNIYDPHKLHDLSQNLKLRQETAFIVGHSNTTPELARLLCECEIEDMEDTEYDRLIVISIADGKTRVKTLQQ